MLILQYEYSNTDVVVRSKLLKWYIALPLPQQQPRADCREPHGEPRLPSLNTYAADVSLLSAIGLGEDGPTHQPIEQLAALRSIPNLNIFIEMSLDTCIVWLSLNKHRIILKLFL